MENISHATENFVLSEGGFAHRVLKKVGLYDKPEKLAIIGLCITWLPLAILSAIKGTLYSNSIMPFLHDYAMQARMLVAVPLMILIRPFIDQKVNIVMKYLSDALMSPEERYEILTNAFARAKRMINSGWTEGIMLLLVIATSTGFFKGGVYSGLAVGTSWMTNSAEGSQSLSLAGIWAVFIAIPLIQFLTYRWLWRYIVWMVMLLRLSKSNLTLMPTHPDRACGLGIIMLAQTAFNLIFVTGSVLISGQFIAELLLHPEDFNSIRNEAIGYIVLCVVLLILPLLFFMGKLFRVKNEGMVSMSNLGADLSRKFEQEWINGLPVEKKPLADPVNPSMIYDYAGMYDYLKQVRPVPINLRDIITLVLALFAPFTPILFIHFSVAELLQKIAGMLI